MNELVVDPHRRSGEPRVIAAGRDFYAAPRISPDGTRLAWLSWDLPWMPWDGCELWVADLAAGRHALGRAPRRRAPTARNRSGSRAGARPASCTSSATAPAGGTSTASATASVAGAASDGGRVRLAALGLRRSPRTRSSDDGRIACIYDAGRRPARRACSTRETGELIDLDLPYTAIAYPYLAAEGEQIAFIAGCADAPRTARVAGLHQPVRSTCCARATTVELDPGYVSSPGAIEFPTEGGLTAYAHFYPPANPDVVGAGGRAPAADRDEPRRADVVAARTSSTSRSSSGPPAGSRWWT